MTSNSVETICLPSIIPLKLGLVNAFILKGKRAVLVDTGYAGNSGKIIRHLSRNSIDLRDLSLIILTHGHIDHHGSARELKSATGAPVAIHIADAQHLARGIDNLGRPTGFAGYVIKSLFARGSEVRTRSLIADIIIAGEMDLSAFGIEGTVIPTPGHTDGSISVILPEGNAIVGDLIMGGVLFRKVPRRPLFLTDVDKWKQSLKIMEKLSSGTIFTSHSGPVPALRLQNFADKILQAK